MGLLAGRRADARAVAAEQLVEQLAPFDEWMVYNGLCSFGSISSILGLVAASLGRYDDVDAWFAKGAAIEDRVRVPACAAETWTWWAGTLLRRRVDDDDARVEALLDEVRPVAEELDLASVRAQVQALGA